MGGKEWTKLETAIIMYFASRHVDHEGCSKILNHKHCPGKKDGERTTPAVRRKLDDLKAIDGVWRGGQGWNRTKVDEYIVSLGVSNLRAVTATGREELDMVAPVRKQSKQP